MALKKEVLKKIAALLKLKEADLETAIKDEKEVDLVIDEKLNTFTEDELKTLKDNEYKTGKEKGVEIAVKEAKEEEGLEFQGKTIKGLLEAKAKKALADAKLTPDKQVTDLQQKVDNLQTTVKTYEKQIADKDAEVDGIVINSELRKHIPIGEESVFDQDDVIAKMKRSGYDFKRENGKVVPYKDGKVVIDKVSNAREAKDVVTDFMVEKKLITKEAGIGGRGDGDRKPAGKVTKMSELKKQFADAGKNVQGQEFAQAVEQARTDNKEFDMNS
jgi:hypothetical protein